MTFNFCLFGLRSLAVHFPAFHSGFIVWAGDSCLLFEILLKFWSEDRSAFAAFHWHIKEETPIGCFSPSLCKHKTNGKLPRVHQCNTYKACMKKWFSYLNLPLVWYDQHLTVYIYGLYKASSVELYSNDTTNACILRFTFHFMNNMREYNRLSFPTCVKPRRKSQVSKYNSKLCDYLFLELLLIKGRKHWNNKIKIKDNESIKKYYIMQTSRE